MRLELLDYQLPDEAIAQRPAHERDGARLLAVGVRGVSHHRLLDWVDLVPPHALAMPRGSRV
jgi:S-adenosylmethionine:tRNA-ribosyltransferase-isomerase (queuine synthetase)